MVREINRPGLTPELLKEIDSRINVHVGDTLDADGYAQLSDTLRQVDEHLLLRYFFSGQPGAVILSISLPPDGPPQIIGGAPAQSGLLISRVPPVYPPEAKRARIQGTVRLQATIDRDGTVQNLRPIEGDPLLVDAAIAAVSQWVYKPYLLNGVPTPVITEITVNFVLN
jgi:TonB family protein